MAADQRKMARTIFLNAVIPEIIVGIAPYLRHRGTFNLSYLDLGVTSCDLSMTLTVFFKFGSKWTLAPKLLGLEWRNLGKSQLNVFTLGLFYF